MLGTSLNKDNNFSMTKGKGNHGSKKKTMSSKPLTAANAIDATIYS